MNIALVCWHGAAKHEIRATRLLICQIVLALDAKAAPIRGYFAPLVANLIQLTVNPFRTVPPNTQAELYGNMVMSCTVHSQCLVYFQILGHQTEGGCVADAHCLE